MKPTTAKTDNEGEALPKHFLKNPPSFEDSLKRAVLYGQRNQPPRASDTMQ